MRRKETEIPFCRSFEQMAGASEGKGHHRKGLREENIPREGLGEKKSVPVVPVIPINFETPPFFSYYL